MIKKTHFGAGLIFLGLGLSGCQQQATQPANTTTTSPKSASVAESDPKVIEEVRALLQKHDKALNEKDIDSIMATFSLDPKTVVLGTGEGEKFVGQDSIREAYTEILKDYDAGTLTTNCDWKTGGVDSAGTTAWVAATCKAEDSLKSNKRDYVLNVSGALEKDAGVWRFVMLHMSNATRTTPPLVSTLKGLDRK